MLTSRIMLPRVCESVSVVNKVMCVRPGQDCRTHRKINVLCTADHYPSRAIHLLGQRKNLHCSPAVVNVSQSIQSRGPNWPCCILRIVTHPSHPPCLRTCSNIFFSLSLPVPLFHVPRYDMQLGGNCRLLRSIIVVISLHPRLGNDPRESTTRGGG